MRSCTRRRILRTDDIGNIGTICCSDGEYEEPIHPRNLWLDDEPLQHAEVDDIYRANIDRLIARGSFTPPARRFPGARYIAPTEDPDQGNWEHVRAAMWPPEDDETG